MSRFAAAMFAVLLILAGAAPAAADKDDHVNLSIFVQLWRPASLPGEEVEVSVRVSNEGPGTATGVVVRTRGDLNLGPWGELDENGPGAVFPPGRQMSFTVTTHANDLGNGLTEEFEVVSNEPDRDPTFNRAMVDPFVTAKRADLDLTVSGDVDRDGVVDPGEPRAGVLVAISGGVEPGEFTARTDATGVAHFLGIPGGEYSAKVQLPKGWYTDLTQRIRVRAGQNTDVIQALLDDLTALSASVSLDRAAYAPGDTVRERVTLTNSGTTDIVGVVAKCGLYGAENTLGSNGWGELSTLSKTGATIRAGQTRTWEFTDVVPLLSWDYGYVLLTCVFVPPGGLDGPLAEARATIPGGRGTFTPTLVSEKNEPLSGVTMLLLDKVTGAVVARAASDGTGRVQFPELPANQYELRPVGPWRLHQSMYAVQVWAGQHTEYPITLSPGPVQADPEALPPSTKKEVTPVSTVDSAPTPQASRPVRPTNLADTGADVRELSVLGLLLVLVGSGLLFVRRRTVS